MHAIRRDQRFLLSTVLVGLMLGALALLAPGAFGRQRAVSIEPLERRDGRTPIPSLPFTIEECGSYILTRCLTGVPGSAGITIDADDVTLDLNGFPLIGVPGSLEGIVVQVGRRNITVFGGTIRGWGGDGVEAAGAADVQLHDLRASDNGGSGLIVGLGGIIRDCTASDNAGNGFVLGQGGIASHSTANGNGVNGIVADFAALAATGCVIEACTSRANSFLGIFAGDGSSISSCAVTQNGVGGVSVGAACVVLDNTVLLNGEDGINAFDSLVRGNASRGNLGAQINAPSSTVIENHE